MIIMRISIDEKFDKFRKISIKIFQIECVFLALFSVIYFVIISLWGLFTGTIDPIAVIFDSLLGLTILSVIYLVYRVSHTRIGTLLISIGFIFWWTVPCNWIIMEWDKMHFNLVGTYITMWIIWGILLGISILGLINFFLETIHIGKQKKSVVFGPWYAALTSANEFFNILFLRKLSSEQKLRVKHAIISIIFIVCIAIPGILPFFVTNVIKIKITPQNYQIKYNFWAAPNATGEYSPEMQALGFGPRWYSDTVLDELNEHKVNMDLMINHITPEGIELLKDWELRCPDITYRIVLYAPTLSMLAQYVFESTQILIDYTLNGTLDQWRGFCFDIEGHGFMYNYSFGSFEQAIGMWNTVFDYIENKRLETGLPIEMENVGIVEACKDIPFDGDADAQMKDLILTYVPLRYTTYAPMLYRCWYGGDKPWGSDMDPMDPWSTSYRVYSQLYVLNKTVPAGTLGVYLGITNTSCYSCDLQQHELYTWPEGENSGLNNLLRDVLIAKHFGIQEVTFFLPWSAPENGYIMGGVFESYGDDFLDVVNNTVNLNPPESFYIYYNHNDAESSEDLRYDWVYDFSKPEGLIQIIGIWMFSIIIIERKSKIKILNAMRNI